MKLLTIDELRTEAAANPTKYLVENLFTEGSFNLVSAEAKAGKSTFLRHLSRCIINGEPFLGRATQQGNVIYVCPDERNKTELVKAFDRLGITTGLYSYPYSVDKPKLAPCLKDWMLELGNVRLIILDTLVKCVHMNDLNDYNAVVADLEEIQSLACDAGVTVICTHHLRKTAGGSIAQNLMGSSGLASLSETTVELQNNYNKRQIRTSQRYGDDIEDLVDLHLDKEAGVVFLGRSVDDKRQENADKRNNEIASTILQAVDEKDRTREELKERVKEVHSGVHVKVINDLADKLVAEGNFYRKGHGRRNSPYIYTNTLPTEIDAPATEAPPDAESKTDWNKLKKVA